MRRNVHNIVQKSSERSARERLPSDREIEEPPPNPIWNGLAKEAFRHRNEIRWAISATLT
jgi:hypothetical protein